jgi:hypothetical protein
MTLAQYIASINRRYQLGNATEHTFRGDLQQLLESLVTDIRATNEPKRQACGAPDYILTKKDIPVGYIEAKDLGDKDLGGLKKAGNKEQFDRYKASLNNLFFTDYLDFHLYRDGQFVTKIAIAEVTDKGIVALPQNFAAFENLIKDFCSHVGQTIKSSKKLAELMAGKARLLADVIGKSLTSDQNNQEDSTLKDQMTAFRQLLIHDITPQGFADVYAQTIAYGMFAARLHDPTLPTFSRQEAAELIPKSNPFLRKLFGYIAGPDIDDRIKWIVDSLVEIFLACNVAEILSNYGKSTKMEDPIIHFYETFLSEYDPALRKARGVWYTPAPVVSFMVRAVDDILKTEFDLPQGLADNSKTKVKVNQQGKQVEQEVHRVQILDPATGTGTFLAEVIKYIHKKFTGQQGIWSNYVETHLLPRLNGFELLMASYAMAHLQLDLLLTETGYQPTTNQRLRVYLTNSLEESHPDTGTLFANWLSTEANEANHIKRDTPVMCVIGNPPYSVSSTNKSAWIESLVADYKKELNERNIQPLSDDYVKFIRFGQYFIDKNESGVLAYISNNSFIDGLIHRQMRKNLLQSFDKVYILDLHGSAKKNETAVDGSPDQNVFDIMQGVSISLLVKTGKKKKNELGQVLHCDLYGKRENKYDFLNENSLDSITWNRIEPNKPNFFLVKKDFSEADSYEKGFKIDDLLYLKSSGIKTHRDHLVIDFKVDELSARIKEFYNPKYDNVSLALKLKLKDNRDWSLASARMLGTFSDKKITTIQYRPLDTRYCYYDSTLIDFGRENVMQQFLGKENWGLVALRQSRDEVQGAFWLAKEIVGKDLVSLLDTCTIFPLYLYPDTSPKPLSARQQAKKVELEHRLAQEKEHFSQISAFFHKTVLPFYESIPNHNENAKKLFEENKATYEEAKAIVEQLEHQLVVLRKPEAKGLFEADQQRKPNLNPEIVKQIAENLGLTFTDEKETTYGTFAPIDLLDYIYAVLHSPTYREKYKAFLKIDFPRVPYPKDQATFWQLVKLGGEIRQVHLLESPIVEQYITQYPEDGDNAVTKIKYQAGKVYINDTQYFANVPPLAWDFYIGGYQPAQKWLKDRKDRQLEFGDILHYQKIIVALTETDRIMQAIDAIDIA